MFDTLSPNPHPSINDFLLIHTPVSTTYLVKLNEKVILLFHLFYGSDTKHIKCDIKIWHFFSSLAKFYHFLYVIVHIGLYIFIHCHPNRFSYFWTHETMSNLRTLWIFECNIENEKKKERNTHKTSARKLIGYIKLDILTEHCF